ncbi:alpha/beta hydrolase [Aliiroseovarius sp.]|uniref:alpha/beta hydrolase n=1 Tax=Aliiroseovarius sp. TaxID=1872442 RepID=UPI002633023D|nr:alpha/beta hydrolase [Aliiroseovarius sp.]
MDYKTLIDAETWAFIHRTGEFYPPDATDMSITDQRRVYDEMSAAFRQPKPEGVSCRDRDFSGVPCRLYQVNGADTTVVFFHGGGFVVGGLDSHDDVCAEICVRTGFRVLAVDYRLSPEHEHPAAFNDAIAATRHAAETWPGTLLLCGDSAGGNLAAATAHALRGEIDFAGQVLIYPGLGGDHDAGSYLDHADAPMLTRDEVLYYMAIRANGPDDPTAAPLRDTDFTDLPRTVTVAAECDPLADDARVYAARIAAAGGQAHCIGELGLTHGYLRGRTTVTRARDSFGRIVSALSALGAGTWPF